MKNNNLIYGDIGILGNRKINGFYFDWDAEDMEFSCRGSVYYDDEHDEMCDPRLEDAAMSFIAQLKEDGYITSYESGEKGWVYIRIHD
jgi:hypothetical protein|tara:strand:- start:357 stop:620 length:264 start_codon:yes stop_codon:yes gene_type:complete